MPQGILPFHICFLNSCLHARLPCRVSAPGELGFGEFVVMSAEEFPGRASKVKPAVQLPW